MRSRHWIGTIAGAAVLAFATALGAVTTPDGPAPRPDSDPGAGAGPTDAAAVPEVPRTRRIARAVYVCADALPVTFSDRPCGPLPELRMIRVREPPPGSAPGVRPAKAEASPRPAVRRPPAEPVPDAREERCRRLLAQRDAINERMRAGYSARQAAQLWTRWRDVGRDIYASRC